MLTLVQQAMKKSMTYDPPLYTAPVGLTQNRATQHKFTNPAPGHALFHLQRLQTRRPEVNVGQDVRRGADIPSTFNGRGKMT
jgi:hypothetical protein